MSVTATGEAVETGAADAADAAVAIDAGSVFDDAAVIALLAGFGGRAPQDVGDEIGSLELTWLIAQFEERHGVVVDLDDVALNRIRTVGQAAAALRGVLDMNGADS